ncbi:MAG: hypothetical protein IKT47_04635 [Oscillospiraceae bacterium]|nr:hypothetical protein [Oscillospiraceae bacterium]
MKRRIIKIISLVLCLLLLCACGQTAVVSYDNVIPPDELPKDIPANWELYEGSKRDIVNASFELYKLIFPGAYILTGSSMGGSKEGYTVFCYGSDIARFEASGILPDGVILDYHPEGNSFDPRLTNEIPRKPETKVEFEDGVTMRMERKEYPPYADYIPFVIESDTDKYFDCDEDLYKYVDGEWQWCPRTYYARLALGGLYDYKLKAGEPQTINISLYANKLGVGLYRLELRGYDIEKGKEYWVEFAVTEDAEPLEPLPTNETSVNSGYALNFFWQCKLPKNCTALKMADLSKVKWPAEACSYSVSHSWDGREKLIAKKLLGEDYSYDAASGEYISGTKVLRLYEGGLSLENSDIEVRAVKLAREYADFDANTVADSGSGRMHSVLEIIMRGRDFSYSCESPSNGVVNFGLKDALEEKRAELSEEDYNAGYSEFESLQFAHGRTFALYSGGMVMPDELKTPCSAVSGGGISGASVSAIVIDHDVAEMTLSGVGSKVEANDDAAPVVSPYDAAAAVLPALKKIKQEFSIVGAEYVYAYHGEDTTTLRPTWLFTVECKDGSEQYFAVDAISGELK